jgi:hypothetical protein
MNPTEAKTYLEKIKFIEILIQSIEPFGSHYKKVGEYLFDNLSPCNKNELTKDLIGNLLKIL